ncbi:hypothetical protein T484DRAFT_1866795 [Baffinella frigidus]|nr:hypothetical protein T484DRAFT_1866795 [Cryptophyta sp. CCMP2293]
MARSCQRCLLNAALLLFSLASTSEAFIPTAPQIFALQQRSRIGPLVCGRGRAGTVAATPMLAQMTPPPPPPRKPPPPPPRTNPGGPAAPAVRGARPVVAPLPTAGSWSNKLGIGLSDRSVVQENARGKPSGKPSRPDGGLTAKIRSKKEKKVGRRDPLPSLLPALARKSL